uniref:Ribosome biogenesis protein RPF2 homolog n=1 Tax=Heterorhabditis bacteriophora TaxID=37862 RepID=A0A1I7WTN6_HETBA
MNNSGYGKTMEDVKKYSDFRLKFDEKRVQRLIDNPRYKRGKMTNNNLVQIEMRQTNIKFNKPIHIGFSVLELSKLHMNRFHYDVMEKKYGDKGKLMYIDTDGIKYFIETEDISEDLKQDKEFATHFDFSNFPKEHYLFNEDNKGVIGKFKIEQAEKIITEFIALAPKKYNFQVFDPAEKKVVEEKKKAKGTKKCVNKTLKAEEYKNALRKDNIVRKEQHVIQAKDNQLFTMKQNKLALNKISQSEFKSHIIDKVNTMNYGHYRLRGKYSIHRN